MYVIPSVFEASRSNIEYLVPPLVAESGLPIAVIMFDPIPQAREEHYLVDPTLKKLYLSRLRLVQDADIILVISDHSRKDALRLLSVDPDRIRTIGIGVDEHFLPPPHGAAVPAEELRRLGIVAPYVLSVLGDDPEMNSGRLVEAFSLMSVAVRQHHQLVVVGKYAGLSRERITALARQFGLSERALVLTGALDDAALVMLYQHARLFVFPSLYEGFGLPLAEAASCGCPAISSGTSAHPEIIECPASTFDPADCGSMRDLMQLGLSNADFRAELFDVARRVAACHRWEHVAAAVVDSIHSASVARRPLSPPPRSFRLALVGPIPPARSGVADYHGALIAELARECALDVYSDAPPSAALRAATDASWWPIEALGRHKSPHAYDRILYAIGNSEHYLFILDAIQKWPGVVWFHEVFLADLLLSYARCRIPRALQTAYLRATLSRLYSPQAAQLGTDAELHSSAWYREHGYGMTSELAGRADAVIVHSPEAREILLRDGGSRAMDTPIHELFLAFPACAPIEERRPICAEDWIVSMGVQDYGKHPFLLLRSFARLARERPDVRLAFVGHLPETIRQELADLARHEGCHDRVTFTGRLPEEECNSWLRRARLAVNVRVSSNGESSAIVASCLSAGTPVITNMPSCLHWPEGVVMKVPLEVTKEQLCNAMTYLLTDPDTRRAQIRKGQRYAADHSFTPLVAALLQVLRAQPAALPRESRRAAMKEPVIICPYVNDLDAAEVRIAFRLDEPAGRRLPFFLWKDEDMIGPELAFEHCWNLFPDNDIILLHTDMTPVPEDVTNRWYDELLQYAGAMPHAGMLACDLLYPLETADGGRLVQSAGGYIIDDKITYIGGDVDVAAGSVGPGARRYDETLKRVRRVDWVTFGGVYIRREVLSLCGPFDRRYQWAYVRDVDYCLEARLRGFELFQLPINLSHFESRTTRPLMANGPGLAAIVRENRRLFAEKWHLSI